MVKMSEERVIERFERELLFVVGVMIGIYGNWLISYFDKLSFILVDGKIIFFIFQVIGFASVLCFFILFFTHWRNLYGVFWIFHFVGLLLSAYCEIKLQSTYFVRFFYFMAIGIVFWILIGFFEVARRDPRILKDVIRRRSKFT